MPAMPMPEDEDNVRVLSLPSARTRVTFAPSFSRSGDWSFEMLAMETSFSVMVAVALAATSMRRPFETVPVTAIFAPVFTVRTLEAHVVLWESATGLPSDHAGVWMLNVAVGSARGVRAS